MTAVSTVKVVVSSFSSSSSSSLLVVYVIHRQCTTVPCPMGGELFSPPAPLLHSDGVQLSSWLCIIMNSSSSNFSSGRIVVYQYLVCRFMPSTWYVDLCHFALSYLSSTKKLFGVHSCLTKHRRTRLYSGSFRDNLTFTFNNNTQKGIKGVPGLRKA